MSEGWAFIKRGLLASAKKRHYYLEDAIKSVCGQILSYEEKLKLNFVRKDNIMSTKICPKCEILLCDCNCHNIGYRGNSIGSCDKCKENHVMIKYVS